MRGNGSATAVAAVAAVLAFAVPAAAKPLKVTSIRPISGPVTLAGCTDTHAENTPQVAVDPLDSRHLATTYAIGAGTASVLATSHDAGATWKRAPIAGTVTCDGGGGQYSDRFDPDLEYSPDGRLYVSESLDAGSGAFTGTRANDTLVAATAPRQDTLGPAVGIVSADPILGAQRGFLEFDGATPGYAAVLTDRFPYLASSLPITSALELSTTTDGGRTFSARTIYSPLPGQYMLAEGLTSQGPTVLAFAERVATTDGFSSSFVGGPMPEQAVVLRSDDGGASFSAPSLVFNRVRGADNISDCCLSRPAVSADGDIYWADPETGALLIHRSSDGGHTWKTFRAAKYAAVSEPQIAVGPDGTLAMSLYELTPDHKMARVHVLVSGNQGQNWRDMPVGSPFAISSLGPVDDSSQLGPVQGIAATKHGFVAAMTVGGPMVQAGGTSDIDLITVRR